MRLRTIATSDKPCSGFPLKTGDDYDPAVLLDLDCRCLPLSSHKCWVGDYVLSGGEIAALVLIDACVRLLAVARLPH
jgi:hypothetical protein